MSQDTEEKPTEAPKHDYNLCDEPLHRHETEEWQVCNAELELLKIKHSIARKEEDIKRIKRRAPKPWYIAAPVFIFESVLVPCVAILLIGFAGGVGAYCGFMVGNWYFI